MVLKTSSMFMAEFRTVKFKVHAVYCGFCLHPGLNSSVTKSYLRKQQQEDGISICR